MRSVTKRILTVKRFDNRPDGGQMTDWESNSDRYLFDYLKFEDKSSKWKHRMSISDPIPGRLVCFWWPIDACQPTTNCIGWWRMSVRDNFYIFCAKVCAWLDANARYESRNLFQTHKFINKTRNLIGTFHLELINKYSTGKNPREQQQQSYVLWQSTAVGSGSGSGPGAAEIIIHLLLWNRRNDTR